MKYFVLAILLISGFVQAQFLPANKVPQKSLTTEVLNRWMDTNKVIHDYQTLIDEMLPTDSEAQAFEQLSAVQQDQIVNSYLKRKGMFEPLNSNMIKLGWTGVADYMRVSSQIGIAIAADLQAERVANMTAEHAKAVMDKSDPAIKTVSQADLDFIRANKKRIAQHFQNYSNAK